MWFPTIIAAGDRERCSERDCEMERKIGNPIGFWTRGCCGLPAGCEIQWFSIKYPRIKAYFRRILKRDFCQLCEFSFHS